MEKIMVHAHRGASAYAPDNTIPAFKKALEMKADAFEFDVHLSSDGYAVVTHDYKVNRCSNGTGYVKDKSLKELKALDVGSWYNPEFQGEKIPTLEEVMDLVRNTYTVLNIEIEANPGFYNEGIEKKVIEIIKAFSMENRVIISCFNHYALAEVKKLAPEIKTGILDLATMYKPWEYAKSFGANAIHPHHHTIFPETIKACKENNIMVNTWTVDKPEDIRRAVDMGVTGIITNVPDIARRVLDELNL